MTDDAIQRTLGRIEARLDEVIRRFAAHDTASAELATRVGRLERWRSYQTGAIAVLTFLVAAALKFFKTT